MFDTPVLPRLETILPEVITGDLVIPDFQRPFVWEDENRLKLLDSISRGMPIGSLLVWRTSRRDLKTYPHLAGVRLNGPRAGSEKVSYVIDGHQRLATLFGALYPGERDPDPDSDVTWPIYYAMDEGQRPSFRIPGRRKVAPEHWLPLNILFDGDKLFEFTQTLRAIGKREMAKEAERLANIFRDYIIPVVPLVTDALDTVTDAFVRINSTGKGMSEAHMLRALTHLSQLDTDKHFLEVRDRLEPLGWGSVNDHVLVNTLKAQLDLDVYGSSVEGLHERLKKNPEPLQSLGGVLEMAIRFFETVGVRGPDALPYAHQLVTVGAVAAQSATDISHSPAQERLQRWFWTTTYGEYFTGLSGNKIRAEIQALIQGEPTESERAPFRMVPFEGFRQNSVRSRALLVVLAQLPDDKEARRRRQEVLAASPPQGVPMLFAKQPRTRAGNRVIATTDELRRLRHAISSGGLTPTDADEFGIPKTALAALPDESAFVATREDWLLARETAFVKSMNLPIEAD